MKKSSHLYILGSLLLMFATACMKHYENTSSSDGPLSFNNPEYKDTPVTTVAEADTLLTFSDLYPVGVRIHDDNIIIKLAPMSDSTIVVYDRQTLKPVWRTGHYGQGPEDVICPDFYASIWTEDSLFQMVDVSDKSRIFLDIKKKKLIKEQLPKYVGFSSFVNSLQDYVIAARNKDDCMFYIYDIQNHHMQSIPFDVDCGDNIKNKIGDMASRLQSGMTFANENKNKIIVPHYFFDEYSVYDLSGKLLKTICLSDDNYDESSVANIVISSNSRIGYVNGFVTNDACYLMRIYDPGQNEGEKIKQLISMDWNGNPQKAYNMTSPTVGDFYVDSNNHLYLIIGPDDNEETYYLVRYDLN